MKTNNYKHLTANGTFSMGGPQCGLETVKVNAADSAGTLTVKDAAGNVIADKIDLTKVYKHDFDIYPLDAIVIVIANASAPDVTVIYQ